MTLNSTPIRNTSCETFTSEIFMAGDTDFARHFLQNLCAKEGLCVSLEKVDYVYTGGMERGFVVRLIQHPRFPENNSNIKEKAMRIAESLLLELGQGSCSVVCSDETIFMSRRAND